MKNKLFFVKVTPEAKNLFNLTISSEDGALAEDFLTEGELIPLLQFYEVSDFRWLNGKIFYSKTPLKLIMNQLFLGKMSGLFPFEPFSFLIKASRMEGFYDVSILSRITPKEELFSLMKVPKSKFRRLLSTLSVAVPLELTNYPFEVHSISFVTIKKWVKEDLFYSIENNNSLSEFLKLGEV